MIRMNVHWMLLVGIACWLEGARHYLLHRQERKNNKQNSDDGDHDDAEVLAVTLHETITVCLLYYLGHAIQLFSSCLGWIPTTRQRQQPHTLLLSIWPFTAARQGTGFLRSIYTNRLALSTATGIQREPGEYKLVRGEGGGLGLQTLSKHNNV